MNFKTLAKFIIVFGVAILLFGGFQYVTNQPEKFDQSKSKKTKMFGVEIRDDMGNMLNVMTNNLGREVNRKNATKKMIAGAIAFFIGIGISASAKSDEHGT